MKRIFRWTGYFCLGLVTLGLAGWGWLGLTAVSGADLPPLKTGDVVFQNTSDSQSLAILLASRSPYTHTGMIELDTAGKPWVVEAVGPVQTIPLDDWIARGTAGRITIKRMKSLTPEQAWQAVTQAHRYDGLPYDFFFTNGEDAIYCSELVHLAYSNGAKISVGAVQRVRDLSLDNFAVRNLIERRWRRHPLCQPVEENTFAGCYQKILDQELVTPASIAADPKFELIYSNFGPIE